MRDVRWELLEILWGTCLSAVSSPRASNDVQHVGGWVNAGHLLPLNQAQTVTVSRHGQDKTNGLGGVQPSSVLY